jgi:hypothetical protein
MKRICAWCGQQLVQGIRHEGLQVTHGVCKDCRRRFFASSQEKKVDSASTLKDVVDDREWTDGHVVPE